MYGCALFFFFNDTATTEIYTLSLHDVLPISHPHGRVRDLAAPECPPSSVGSRILVESKHPFGEFRAITDRKSTRLNSSHANISYAVFCLKKKNSINNVSLLI